MFMIGLKYFPYLNINQFMFIYYKLQITAE